MRCADAHPRLAELYRQLLALPTRPAAELAGRALDADWLELAEELQPLWQEHEHCWRAEGEAAGWLGGG